MRATLDRLEQFAIDVILERRFGKRAALLRWALYGLSWLFRAGVQTRIWLFRHAFFKQAYPGVLVISVGNLTVGGTGKTPVVERLARTLKDGGRRVAILSRGYKAKKPPLLRRLQRKWLGLEKNKSRIVHDGEKLLLDSRFAGDEPYMLARSLKNVPVVVDKDRVRAAHYAVRNLGCDVLILDDGMQYLHLGRRVEIVLVDCQAPFGNGFLLPRGTLREPPSNLRRASYLFLTKSDGHRQDQLIEDLRQHNRTADVIVTNHQPLYLQNLYAANDRQQLDFLRGKYIGVISGIARPESFEGKLTELGAELVIVKRFADHHRFSDDELSEFMARAVRRDLDCIVTTEKDSVRFPYQFSGDTVPIYYLRIEIAFLDGQENWQVFVDRLCEPQPVVKPRRYFA